MDDTTLITKTYNDFRNTEQERLCPKFQQFPLIFHHVSIIPDLCRCLEFHPVDNVFLSSRLAVPDCQVISMCAWRSSVVSIPASTSPPIISRVLPIPVRTIEQYWALLFTTSSSRDSISSRVVGSHGWLRRDSVSNLYPNSINNSTLEWRKRIYATPIGHHILRRHPWGHSLILL